MIAPLSPPHARLMPPALNRAFSLVETALALGIVAFGLLSIIALLPMGLASYRQAIRYNIEADLVQQLARELENTPFDEIDNFPTQFAFDFEAREIWNSADSEEAPADPAFDVTITVRDADVQGAVIADTINSLSLMKRATMEITQGSDSSRHSILITNRLPIQEVKQ